MIRNKGFTLVEIMVVVAVIAVLTTAVGPSIGGLIEKAKLSAVRAETQSIVLGLTAYKADTGRYPGVDVGGCAGGTYAYYYGNAENLNSYLMAPGAFYLNKKIGLDPWERGYYYHTYMCSNPYVDAVFYSAGPDGVDSSWSGGVWLTGAFAGDDIGAMVDG